MKEKIALFFNILKLESFDLLNISRQLLNILQNNINYMSLIFIFFYLLNKKFFAYCPQHAPRSLIHSPLTLGKIVKS